MAICDASAEEAEYDAEHPEAMATSKKQNAKEKSTLTYTGLSPDYRFHRRGSEQTSDQGGAEN